MAVMKKQTRDFESPAIGVMERKMRDEYSTARFRYESQKQLSAAMKEAAEKEPVTAPMSWVPLQVIEPAVGAGRVWR